MVVFGFLMEDQAGLLVAADYYLQIVQKPVKLKFNSLKKTST